MTEQKVVGLEELAVIVGQARAAGKTVVQCHGVFDLMHPGHIKHFEAAKALGDILVVTVTPDAFVNKGPDRPVFPDTLRAESIAALNAVDYVAITRTPTASPVIELVRPSVFVKGQDLALAAQDPTSLTYAEKVAVETHGGRIHFTNEPVVFSSSRLLTNYFGNYPEATKRFLFDFRTAHAPEELAQLFDKVRGLKVLVIGDTIIDQYHYAQAVGHSSKEMMMSVRFEEEELFAGGVLAAANTLAGFCESVDLITTLGKQNSYEAYVREHLRSNIQPTLLFRDDAPTTAIRRYLGKVFLNKMFQVYFTNDAPLPDDTERAFLDQLETRLPAYDVVIVFDYGFGMFTPKIISTLEARSRFLCVNTQTNSINRGFNPITKYTRANFICIDEPEIRVATRKKYAPVKDLVLEISQRMKVDKIILTRGHRGSMTYDSASGVFHEIPVLSRNVVDRTGAGDAYFSVTAPLAALGTPLETMGFFGNVAGAIAVTIVCNRDPVKKEDLLSFAKTLLK